MDTQKKQQVGFQKQINSLQEQIIKDFLKKNKYQYEKVLGQGDFSQVVQAFSEKHNCKVAIKILKKLDNQNSINLEEFEKEIQILQMLKNEKYVLQIIEKLQDEQQELSAIVTELCDCNLTKIMTLNQFSIEQTIAITFQLLKGLLILQEIGIIHSDIKPDNILYSKSKNQFVIADYGLSKILQDPSSQKTLSSLKGNWKYQSPEVMNGQKPYKVKVDVYSIGLLITETLLQREFQPMEWMNLKSQKLLQVFPAFRDSANFRFIELVLQNMVEPAADIRYKPIKLLQLLRTFQIDENSLTKLKLQNELRKLYVDKIEDIIKGIDYDVLEINLMYNNIGAEGTKIIGSSLQQCQNLTSLSLNLGSNNIGVEGTKIIGSSLQQCQNLTSLSLNLGDNNIGAEGTKIIGSSLQQCQNLTSLSLNLMYNNIGVEGTKIIDTHIYQCKNLTSLSLNFMKNKIGDEGTILLGVGLEKCQNLTSLILYLRDNQIGAKGKQQIEESLKRCPKINPLTLELSELNEGEDYTYDFLNKYWEFDM